MQVPGDTSRIHALGGSFIQLMYNVCIHMYLVCCVVNTVKPVKIEPPCDNILCSELTGLWFIQVKLTNI